MGEKDTLSGKIMKLTVSRIQRFNDNVNVETVESFDGYEIVNGAKELKSVNSFSMHIRVFTAQVCGLNDDIADYRNCRTSSFDQAALGKLFGSGTEFTVERVPYKAGEEIKDADGENLVDEDGQILVHKNDGFTTNIIGLKLTGRAQARLDAALTL